MDIRSLIETEENVAPRTYSATMAAKQPAQQIGSESHNKPFVGKEEALYLARETRAPPTPTHSTGQHPGISPLFNGLSPTEHHIMLQSRGSTSQDLSPRQIRSESYTSQPNTYLSQDGRLVIGTPTNNSLNPTTPLTPTPTGSMPGSANGYSNWHRPSSSQSASTPTSAVPPSQQHLQGSPQSHHVPDGSRYPPPPQHLSPQSGTPLGPPTMFPRPSLDHQHTSPRSMSHKRNFSGEIRGNESPKVNTLSPLQNGSRRISNTEMNHRYGRQDSVSVSPKTQATSLPQNESWQANGRPSDVPGARATTRPGEFKSETGFSTPQSAGLLARRTSSMGIDSMLNAAPAADSSNKRLKLSPNNDSPAFLYHTEPTNSSEEQKPQPTQSLRPTNQTSQDSTLTSSSPTTSQIYSQRASLTSTSETQQSLSTSPSDMSRAKKTENVPEQVKLEPIEAPEPVQPGPGSFKTDVAPQRTRKKARLASATDVATPASQHSVPPATEDKKAEAKGRPSSKPPRLLKPIWAYSVRDTPLDAATQDPEKYGLPSAMANSTAHAQTNGMASTSALHLEPSIQNTNPPEDLVKMVADFIYQKMVARNEIGVVPTRGTSLKGAVFEIEAKLGRHISGFTNDRLTVPVLTEAVLSRGDPNMKTSFESSMTQKQHKFLNDFLNNALRASLKPKSNDQNTGEPADVRLPMSYSHTREVDTFYELSQDGLLALPKELEINSRPSNKVKVRVTRDQKTNRELARIVKTRVADLEISSPQNQVDWRISINVEMDFEGNVDHLMVRDSRPGMQGERHKDRISYKQGPYQIDLTQVTPSQSDPDVKKERQHELEIEVSAAELRKHGNLAFAQQPNKYMDLIKGLVNNIRLLARQVPNDYIPPRF